MIERVISADCHVTEPPSVFDRVPKSLRDRVPKVMTGADGGEGWSFDGKPPKRTLGVEAMAGQASGKASGLRFDEILPGNFDGVAHAAAEFPFGAGAARAQHGDQSGKRYKGKNVSHSSGLISGRDYADVWACKV